MSAALKSWEKIKTQILVKEGVQVGKMICAI